MMADSKGGHEWLIEFIKAPENITAFAAELDKALRQINSDYDAKRYKNMAMDPLVITQLSSGTIEKWQRKHKRFGGQNKMPRLKNDRTIVEWLLSYK